MLDFTMIDPTYDRTEDPLKAAEELVAMREYYFDVARRDHARGELSADELLDRDEDLESARTALVTLRAKLAAEADDELPYQ